MVEEIKEEKERKKVGLGLTVNYSVNHNDFSAETCAVSEDQ